MPHGRSIAPELPNHVIRSLTSFAFNVATSSDAPRSSIGRRSALSSVLGYDCGMVNGDESRICLCDPVRKRP